ncbi:FMN-dependent NADH-azoreductase [Ferrimonas senticii]|uniref:FMN-dependent NADH-azoreductase n=1 Tax=Ferrimonas senticii TaxID=394566 RepID=UPI00040DA7F3|nr:NAD(P)H-dependent oxidoreductase [Ferrimonas senticii]
MKNLLVISASPNPDTSVSRQLAQFYQQQWQQQYPQGTAVLRDLATSALPVLDQATINAFYTPAEQRDEQAKQLLSLSDQLVAELQQADEIVIATPMHNFSVAANLKLWIDLVCRVGVTFRYGANGPEGLLLNKQATLIVSRGGRYGAGSFGASMNFQDPMLVQVLGFIGINQVAVIAAEGLAGSQEGVEQAKAQILQQFAR